MMFAQVENGLVVASEDENQLRFLYPEVCLPKDLTSCMYLIERGWRPVISMPQPKVNEATEYVVEGVPALVDGNLFILQTWDVREYTQLEIDAKVEANRALLRAQISNTIDAWMDEVAQHLDYTDRYSICTYVTSTIQKFREEAVAFKTWRDSVWAACMQIEQDTLAGLRDAPTPSAMIAELPSPDFAYVA